MRINAKAEVRLSPRRERMIAVSSEEKKKEGTDFLELEDFTIEQTQSNEGDGKKADNQSQ